MKITLTQLVDCMKEFFQSKCYPWASDGKLNVLDDLLGHATYAISLKDSIGIGFRFRRYLNSDVIAYALFTYEYGYNGEYKTLFAYEGDRGVITMDECPPALEDIISREDIEEFAIHMAKTFRVDCDLILKRKIKEEN